MFFVNIFLQRLEGDLDCILDKQDISKQLIVTFQQLSDPYAYDQNWFICQQAWLAFVSSSNKLEMTLLIIAREG